MKKIIILTLVIAIVLSGCASTNVKDKSEYRWVYSGEVTTLNYLVTTSTNEFGLAANLVDTLIDYDPYGVPKPALATEWSVSDDNLVWTFKLREGVKWYTNDLKEYAEVTAQDFVDAMEYILDPTNESRSANIAYGVLKNAESYYNGDITDFNEVGVKAKDKYTLEYTLEMPVPYFLSMVTYVCFFPVNGEFLVEVGDEFGTDNTKILYNGAYILETFEPQNRRILVKNDKYWDKNNVNIERLVATFNSEAETLGPELFARGEIDTATIPSTILDDWMNDSAKAKLIRPNRTTYYSYFYAFNFDPLFPEEYEPDNWKVAVNNVNFRKAIFHALDRKAAMITAEPYDPEKRIQNTITPKDFVDLNGTDYTQLGTLGKIVDVDTFNDKKALEYKDKAMKDLDGVATFPVKVLMPYNTSSSGGAAGWTNRAQVIEQQLENLLGKDFIDIVIEPKPPTGFLQDVRRAGQFALLECNWGPDYADPETYTDPFIPSGTYNKPHLALGYTESNGKTKYENMIDKAKVERVDIEKRLNLFAEAEAFLINEAFIIPYGVGGGGYVASRLNPFESAYSPFGVSSERYKGHHLLEEPMDTDTFNELLSVWNIERVEALKQAK
ncbi:MAG: peptide ABC transporter substrate-binding protein [Tissierellaceae bacterium]|nr:peptide ABC transporter substrate-binding protein [Tissierellaceae bacterium]